MSNTKITENRVCEVCGIDITDKKATARTCSPRCRKALHDQVSVTPNVTLNDPPVTLSFKFKTKDKRSSSGFHQDNSKDIIRTSRYWYDVPLGAVPVRQKGWPEMPDYMNGRQYFLWWKNEFKTNEYTNKETGEVTDMPEILNPYPQYSNSDYVNAGEGSRRWGA